MTISITRQHIISILILTAGLVFLCLGIRARIEYTKTVDLAELDISSCREGQFVTGSITCLLRKDMNGLGKNYVGISEDYSGGLVDDYTVYTVPVKNGAFIRLLVTDHDTQKSLDALIEKGSGTPVPFEGAVVRLPLTHTDWYADDRQFDPESFSLKALESVYAVRQQHHHRKIEWIYAGIVFLVLGAYLLVKSRPGEIFFKKYGQSE